MYNTDEIKSRISCQSYLSSMGVRIGRNNRCVSPIRVGAKNPSSFYVTDDSWYDFGLAQGGDVIDLCAILEHNGNKGDAIRDLASRTGVKLDAPQRWKDDIQALCNRTAAYHNALTQEDYDYLSDRGFTKETVDRMMIGRVTDGYLKGRLFLPYFKNGAVVYYATRALPGSAFPDNKYMKASTSECDSYEHIPWGMHTLNRTTDTLIISEGYFDALSWETNGYAVLSPITGSFSSSQMPFVLSAAKMFKRVLLIFDNDPTSHAGEGFTRRMAQIFFKNSIPFVVSHTPSGIKDVNEYYSKGGDLSKLISSAQDGLAFLINLYDNYDAIKEFLIPLARVLPQDKIESALAESTHITDPQRKTLLKILRHVPTETRISDEILSKHELLYVLNIGFYEYDGVCWKFIDDSVVRSYADKQYGLFSTYQRCCSATKLTADRVSTADVFDKKPLWNFPNGTLDLTTGKFREHRKDDYCSFIATFNYDPNATCPNWEHFISVIMNDRPEEMEILQFIPAYAMFSDCKHEKIFILIGEGSNGKSRYTMILEKLFAPKVSNLKPIDMLQKFDLIHMRDSLINIAGEIKTDLGKTEEILKQIASGETVRACYKGKDVVEFNPRAKLIFACNGQLSSSDTSDGLSRRLVIVDFPMRFTETPTKPNERPVDRDLINKLIPELPGIFNWAYQGYQLLNQVGYFTVTHQQTELLDSFRRASNPVMVFYEETDSIPPVVSFKHLYELYTHWCEESGNQPLPRNKFTNEFARTATDTYDRFSKTFRTISGVKCIKGFVQKRFENRIEYQMIDYLNALPTTDQPMPEGVHWIYEPYV